MCYVIQGRNSLFCGSLLQQWEGKLDSARHAVHSSIPQSLAHSELLARHRGRGCTVPSPRRLFKNFDVQGTRKFFATRLSQPQTGKKISP